MGIEAALLTNILLGVSAAGTVGSLYSQSRAANAQGKAAQAQRRQEALSAAIQRRQAVKAGRQAQAIAIQAGENQGVSGSSGAQGGAGSIRSQTTANLSFLDKQTQLAEYGGRMFDRAARWNNRAQLFQGVASLAMVGADQVASADAAKRQEEQYAKMFAGRPGAPKV